VPLAGAVSESPLVTVFTAAYESGSSIERAYQSLLRQSYPHWEWVVVDESPTLDTSERVARLVQSPGSEGRVRLYRQQPYSGSIGATKAAAAGLGRGEILVELDHDDELLPEALDLVVASFSDRSDVDFVYSDWIDVVDGEASAGYPTGWGFGFGAYATEMIADDRLPAAVAAPITWETVRHIVSVPNHLRAWRRNFYKRVGGYDPRLEVADDYELLVRTFLKGTMARIPRPLYIQHHRSDGKSGSRRRNAEIQRLVAEQAARYEHDIDQRCESLGLAPWPADCSPLMAWRPVRAANVVVDVLADAAERIGMPLVSVVVTAHERPERVETAVVTALEQTYSNVEVLVVGGGDPSVNDVVAAIDDIRVRHWSLPERSVEHACAQRNYALKVMARGALVAYLDDDQAWKRNHLESLVATLRSHGGATVAISRGSRPRAIQPSAILHKRELLERYGYWESDGQGTHPHGWTPTARWPDEQWISSSETTIEERARCDHPRRGRADTARGAEHRTTTDRPRHVAFKREPPHLLVVDDFYEGPDDIRALALAQEYFSDSARFKGRRTRERFLWPGLREEFSRLLGARIGDWENLDMNGCFQQTTYDDPLVWHHDLQSYAAAVYLSPSAPLSGGTRFWRDRTHGCRRPPAHPLESRRLGDPSVRDAAERAIYDEYNLLHEDNWELVDEIGAVYNRLVIWDAQLIHSAGTYEGFRDERTAPSRLVQLFFFNMA
jgi:glycosyltransferase involved in cell wall biosynthesis